MIRKQKVSRSALAKELGLSRASLYYVSKKLPKDWVLRRNIEKVMAENPGYGYRRVADDLKENRKRVQRVMRLFGLKAYRRPGKKRSQSKAAGSYPNLLKTIFPVRPNHIWASDFTLIPWKNRFLYLGTVIDLFTREVVGWALQTSHGAPLILQALYVALHHHSKPDIFHSDNGREYGARVVRNTLEKLAVKISRSAPGAPWENGYQEGFYSQFKVDLGDSKRFKILGELIAEIYHLIWKYNHERIHSALRMPPLLFAERYQRYQEKLMQKVS